MSDWAGFWIGAGIAAAGYCIAHGLDAIGTGIREALKKL